MKYLAKNSIKIGGKHINPNDVFVIKDKKDVEYLKSVGAIEEVKSTNDKKEVKK